MKFLPLLRQSWPEIKVLLSGLLARRLVVVVDHEVEADVAVPCEHVNILSVQTIAETLNTTVLICRTFALCHFQY